jgi:excinuclease ABC subunit C
MALNKTLESKLKNLPTTPGVYFHKNKAGQIIYVGKALNLKNRVRQYFRSNSKFDPKTKALIADIEDTDWMQTESEIDALFLEAEMIKRYMPKYNILLRDDKSLVYIRININSDYPTVTLTRHPLDDKARYFGPYLSSLSVKRALKSLRPIFPYAINNNKALKRVNISYHLGLDPGLEEGKTSLSDYRHNLRQLIRILEGKRNSLVKDIEAEMKHFAQLEDYQKAAKARNKLIALKGLSQKIMFSDYDFIDLSKDHALDEIVRLFNLKKAPARIEGYDISHMSGKEVVASMVVFKNAVSDKTSYRRFKIKIDRNNDFYNMNEVISRRFALRNIKSWGLPDLVLIDGGKGQLGAALKARNAQKVKVPFIGLAKKEELVIIDKLGSNITLNLDYLKKLNGYKTETPEFFSVKLPTNSNILKLLQRIRDESHRFAISYHSLLKTKKMTLSAIDAIPGIGPKTKKALLSKYASIQEVQAESISGLSKVIPADKARKIKSYFIE